MENKATNEIILEEGGLETLIRRLVEKSKEEQICMTTLLEAVESVWKETENSQTEKCEFTVSETLFSEKVQRFIEQYKTELIQFYIAEYQMHPDLIREDKILTKYYRIVCAMFMCLEREDKVSQKAINKFIGKRYVRLSNNCNKEDIKVLRSLLCKLEFNSEIPKVGQKVSGHIYKMSEVKELKEKYAVVNNVIMETALTLIWLIKKYF